MPIPKKSEKGNDEIVRVNLSGYIEMKREDLERILAYPDPHMGLVFVVHMGFVNSDNVIFDPEGY